MAAANSRKRMRPDDLKVGDRLACVQYYTCTKTADENGNGYYSLKTEEGSSSLVAPDVLSSEFWSAEQFSETKDVTQTAIIERFLDARDSVFSATFNKKLTPKDIEQQLAAVTAGDLSSKKKRTALAKKLLEGEERTIKGYLVKSEPTYARSLVIDLEVKVADPSKIVAKDRGNDSDDEKEGKHFDPRHRQIDHRTLSTLIIKNVRYRVKSK